MTPNILPIYKPKGPTSHDIINQLRKITGIKRIGHAGTLDPLASGVLVVGLGREATKQLDKFVKKEKEYLAIIRLGFESTTDDEEGKKNEIPVDKVPKVNDIKKVISDFEDEILQTPPIYSAVKVQGQRAYKTARKNEQGSDLPKLKPRKVSIKKIEILKYEWPYLKLKVTTGPGVYIRALARDIGKKLGTGGYLIELERGRVGEYRIQKALTIKDFEKFWRTRRNLSI